MKKSLFLGIVMISATAFIFSGCKKGEEDPFFTIHSRDARMSQPWVLKGINGSIVVTTGDSTVNTEYTYDGTNLYVTTGAHTDSYAYTYKMNIMDDGQVFSQETSTELIEGANEASSSNTGYWYWGNDVKNKTSVNLDLTGIFADYLNYDIPRLAWNDMTLSILASDNYTDPSGAASSVNSNFELQFEVDLDVINGTE